MEIIEAGLAVDDRGTIVFANDFDFKGVKRFFTTQNHSKGTIRAWHAHKKEERYVFVAAGSIILGVVKIDDWDKPESSSAQRLIVSASKPQIVHIPAGCATGFMSLTDDAHVIFFSTTTTEEAKDDDFRFPADMWNIWDVEAR